jgi:hypothetical protein
MSLLPPLDQLGDLAFVQILIAALICKDRSVTYMIKIASVLKMNLARLANILLLEMCVVLLRPSDPCLSIPIVATLTYNSVLCLLVVFNQFVPSGSIVSTDLATIMARGIIVVL